MPKLNLSEEELETIHDALMKVIEGGEPKEVAAVSRLLLSFGFLDKQPKPVPEHITLEFILRKVTPENPEGEVTRTISTNKVPESFYQEED